jgi:excisionase family DNA binding protein
MVLMTLNETAAELRLGPTKLWQLTARGELPVVRLGRRVLVTRTDLDAYIEAHREGGDESTTGSGQLPVVRGSQQVRRGRRTQA